MEKWEEDRPSRSKERARRCQARHLQGHRRLWMLWLRLGGRCEEARIERWDVVTVVPVCPMG